MSLDNYAQIIGRFARYPLAKIIPRRQRCNSLSSEQPWPRQLGTGGRLFSSPRFCAAGGCSWRRTSHATSG